MVRVLLCFAAHVFIFFKLAERSLRIEENQATTDHIKFNKSKCWILHLRQGNLEHKYRLEGSPTKRDLGILVNTNLNMNQ